MPIRCRKIEEAYTSKQQNQKKNWQQRNISENKIQLFENRHNDKSLSRIRKTENLNTVAVRNEGRDITTRFLKSVNIPSPQAQSSAPRAPPLPHTSGQRKCRSGSHVIQVLRGSASPASHVTR